jgi:hypothetical protein
MKKIVLLLIANYFILFANAQNGVAINATGTPPNANAMLDVEAANKGLLIPRVNLVTLTTNNLSAFGISATPVTSLLVYNTTASTLPSTIFQTGFYYWEGSNWIKLNTGATSSAATGWTLTGNSGTTLINFIGTTDAQPIRFGLNNKSAGIIDSINKNTAIGYAGLRSNTTGSLNAAVGFKSLAKNTTGNENTALGDFSLFSNTAGNGNAAVGSSALENNTTGFSNVAIGNYALVSNSLGSNQVAIGDSALYSNQSQFLIGETGPYTYTPSNNTAIGSKALFGNLGGNNNTAIGYNSMKNNNATNSLGIGMNAYKNGGGFENIAIGTSSMQDASGSYNTVVGDYALSNNLGQYNVSVGRSSLGQNKSGGNNTALGTNSLSFNRTGNYNTAIGANANVRDTNFVNATAVGAQARVDCSNCLVLGSKNTINGATSDVNVGIGNTAPVYRLDVIGKQKIYSTALFNSILGGVSGGALLIENSSNNYQTLFDGNRIQTQRPDPFFGTVFGDLALNAGGGAVSIGLGTNSANARLHIEKPPTGTLGGNVPSAVQINGTQFNTVFNYGGQEEISIQSGKTGSTVSINTVSNGNILLGGNVGLSNSSPTAKLDIVTAGSVTKPHIRMYEFNNDYARLEFKNSTGNNYWHIAGYNNPTNASERLNFYNNTTGDIMSITGDGKVGIGTTTPEEKLTVVTPANSNGITHSDGSIKLTTYLGGATNGAYFGTPTNHPLSFYTNNSSAQVTLLQSGDFLIGTNNLTSGAGYKLRVGGKIFSEEVRVQLQSAWPDYVFDKKYKKMSIVELDKYLNENNHLPNIPSAMEIEKDGQHLGEIQRKMLEKIEELTLYIIELNKRIDKLESEKLITSKKLN